MPTGQYIRKPGVKRAKRPVPERFMEFVLPEPMSGCWFWMGALSTTEYGVFSFNGKPEYAHRVSYKLFMGEIPEDLDMDHKCRITFCVNPYHVEPVTPRENTRRGLCGVLKTQCKNGHIFDEENTYIRKTSTGIGRMCKACGRTNKRKEVKANVRSEPTNSDSQQLV